MGALRYRCLVLDHDDTAVDSTAHLHHPAFLGCVELLRPGAPAASMTLEDYFRMNADPGLGPYYKDVLGLTEDELAFEQKYWLDYVASHVPVAYPGIRALIEEQRARGGLVCVVSHSRRENILRDYRETACPCPSSSMGATCPGSGRSLIPGPFWT